GVTRNHYFAQWWQPEKIQAQAPARQQLVRFPHSPESPAAPLQEAVELEQMEVDVQELGWKPRANRGCFAWQFGSKNGWHNRLFLRFFVTGQALSRISFFLIFLYFLLDSRFCFYHYDRRYFPIHYLKGASMRGLLARRWRGFTLIEL